MNHRQRLTIYLVYPVRKELLDFLCFLSTDERFKVLAVRRFPYALARTSKADDGRRETEQTYKWPTGFPPTEAVGHANQTIPFAAHLRSVFLSTTIMFFPSEDIFLHMREKVS